jgi:chitinase
LAAQASKYPLIAIWGNNKNKDIWWGDESVWEKSLRFACEAPNTDIVNIYAVNAFFGNKNYLGMQLSTHCTTKYSGFTSASSASSLLSCPSVGRDIQYCQSLGVKVMITIGTVIIKRSSSEYTSTVVAK